jgi:aldose sugar dehydrogenase
MRAFPLACFPALLLIGCNGYGESIASGNGAAAAPVPAQRAGQPFAIAEVAKLDEPWAMAFLPDGRLLVTEKKGRLRLERVDRSVGYDYFIEVAGVPKVDYGGQGGLGDVVLHPDFANNNLVYLSWVEAGDGNRRGAAVGRGRLIVEGTGARLDAFEVIWRQEPKMSGRGHYGHRLAFGPDGHLYISNGDRQEFTPAQDMRQDLGKILRLTDTGAVPADNPFNSATGDSTRNAAIWTLGHRNPLGIAFDGAGRLWEHEMGPRGGDEFNLIERGRNYGYPIVSNGDHYDGRLIPDHRTRPEFAAPKISWTPVISPAGLIIYSGSMFPEWRGDALMGGLSGKVLVRVDLNGTNASEANRWPMGERIREVEQGPDGAIWLLEDGKGGRLLKLTRPR